MGTVERHWGGLSGCRKETGEEERRFQELCACGSVAAFGSESSKPHKTQVSEGSGRIRTQVEDRYWPRVPLPIVEVRGQVR